MAAEVLTDPRPSLPVTGVAAGLARDLDATVVWSAVVEDDGLAEGAGAADDGGVTCVWLRGGPARGSVPSGAALRPVLGLPTSAHDVHFAPGDGLDVEGEARGHPPQGAARCQEPGRARSSAAVALAALPLRLGRRTRWFFVGRARPFSSEERAVLRTVHALLAGLADHVALVRTGPTTAAGRSAGRAAGGSAGPVGAPEDVVLTSREQSVLALMAQGLISGAIGRRLGVSPRTVAKHQEHIYRKLDASDRLSAVLRAQEAGLLVRPGEDTSG